MDNKTAFRHLTKRVALDKETITYRLLSRELGITVSSAKLILQAYLSDPQAIERGVSPTWILTGTLKDVNEDETTMEIDSEQPAPTPSQDDESRGARVDTNKVQRRTIMLVRGADVDSKATLFVSPPSRAIYSLSPAPLPTLSLLLSCTLSSVTDAAKLKWKPLPSDSKEGYGQIVNEKGEGRSKVDPKGKGKAIVKSTTTTAVASGSGTSKPAVASNSGAKTSAATKEKESEKGKEKEKAKVVSRPMGALKGLFASKAAPPAAAVVPKKRKSSPPPAAKKPAEKEKPKPTKIVSNGLFDDEMDEDDDDEQAMREMEEELAREVKAESLKKKKEVNPSNGANGSKGAGGVKESKFEREKRELEALMNEDDDAMDVDEKPGTGPSKASKPAVAAKPKTQSSLNSFVKK